MIFYLYVHVDKLIYNKDDKITLREESVDLEKAPEIKYTDMSFIYSFNVVNGTHMVPRPYDDEAKRYLTIKFYQNEWDYTSNPPTLPTRTDMGIRSCVVEDFNRTEKLQKKFLELKSSYIDHLCPENNTMSFLGSSQLLVAKFITISFMRCNDENKLIKGPCASEEDQIIWLNKHVIWFNAFNDHVDFQMRNDTLPVY